MKKIVVHAMTGDRENCFLARFDLYSVESV
ncbi:hypothetical protein NKDENANG_00042 [Candidatus Entotheonellaceae bacterium PAL068K]